MKEHGHLLSVNSGRNMNILMLCDSIVSGHLSREIIRAPAVKIPSQGSMEAGAGDQEKDGFQQSAASEASMAFGCCYSVSWSGEAVACPCWLPTAGCL